MNHGAAIAPPNSPRPQTTPFRAKSPVPSHAESPAFAPATKIFVLLTAGALALATLLALLPAAGHDQLWCLYVANRMLHGVPLYGPQILESNPPLIMWALLLPVRLANLLHLPSTLLFKLSVLLLLAASALVSLRLLRRLSPALGHLDPRRSRSGETRFSRPILWSLAFAFVTTFAVLPARDFGQRDHLLALLALPYLLAAALQLNPATRNRPHPQTGPRSSLPFPAATLLGIAAGLGFALKPHQLLVPIAVELALLLHHRNVRSLRRPEPWAILLTSLAYLAAIRLLTPAYLTQILPILRQTYWAIGHLTLPELIAQSLQLHLLLAATLALSLLNRRHPAAYPNLRTAANLLLLAGLASTVAYYLQGTGWYYQQLPALSFTALSLWLHFIDLAIRHPLPIPLWLPKATAALVLLAVALTTHFTGYPFTPARSLPITSPDPTFFTNLPPNSPIAILTTAVDDSIPPLFRYHLTWAQRTNNLWILPAILRNEDPQGTPPRHLIPPAQLAQLDRDQHRFMAEDLTRRHPRLILIARCQDPQVHCQVLEDRHDNLLAWFARDPAFRAVFAHYHYLRSSGLYDAYVPN